MSTDAIAPTPSWLEQLRANPRLPLMLGASALVAAAAAAMLWSRAPDYGVLYSNLSDRDGGAIIASLQQMNIPYKFTEGGGALMVSADKVPEARLRLAAQGLPKGGNVGFELLDNQKFGTSQFAEQINYQRALEGELARSINSISAVSSARVHLALPKPSLFVRDQKKPSASVVLTLHPGRAIDEGQISAVVHLVSSSVPELSAKSVTVVDQQGNLLSTANAGTRGLDTSQLKYSQEIEQGYVRRIEAILQPFVGAGNVHVQVSADIDFSIIESTDEKYFPNNDPARAAIRSQQLSESGQQTAGALAGGVPGALSNQPPATPRTDGAGSAALGGANPGTRRKDGTTNYELDHSIRHVQHAPGGVKRLSVAVLVNHRGTLNAQGKPTTQALSEADLEKITNLVKETMGFSNERGDSVNVVNSPFATDPVLAVAELPWWRQPENLALAGTAGKSLMFGLLALSLLFWVVRPLMRKAQPMQSLAQAPLVSGALDADGEATSVNVSTQGEMSQVKRHHENVKYAQDAAVKGPQMVAMLVKHWMSQKDA
jgi:flagellar M-ring protein FliF